MKSRFKNGLLTAAIIAIFGWTLSVIALDQGDATINGTATISESVKCDTIVEATASAGVTIENILLKDSAIYGNLTADRVLLSNGTGAIVAAGVTDVELEYIDGVTSNVQDQIDGKADDGANSDITSLTAVTAISNIDPSSTGSLNNCIGSSSGSSMTSAFRNACFGSSSGTGLLGGYQNVLIGGLAGEYLTTGFNNVAIGDQAGPTGTGVNGSIFIGTQAGLNATAGSNELWIANSNTTTPLIFGDFSAGRVGIGTATPGTDVVGTYDYTATPLLQVDGATPRLIARGSTNAALDLIDTGAASGEKWMQLVNGDGVTKFYGIDDSGGVANDNIIVIDNTNGNVGIGTASPGYPLEVTGNAYFSADVSALSFTDRTPFYDGDALAELKKVKGKDGHIDHKSLPVFAQAKIKDKDPDTGEEIETEGRDLGAMISILTKAVQQLTERNDALSARIAILENQ